MPLYYRENDVNFIDAINVELINNIIDTTINVFKISLYDTKENLYGEALRKIYFPAVKCAALIEPAETETITDEFGSRITQTIDFRFHRNTLIDIDLVLEVGDIIEWNNKQYEIDTVKGDQMLGGQVSLKHGIYCATHLTRKSRTKIKRIKRAVQDNIDSLYK